MSGVFQQVLHELGIKQYRSSAYHPESEGVLEKFHQTLKNMIRSYCFDTEKDLDEIMHLLRFAVRESVQESLGFSARPHCSWTFITFKREISLTRRHSLELTLNICMIFKASY